MTWFPSSTDTSVDVYWSFAMQLDSRWNVFLDVVEIASRGKTRERKAFFWSLDTVLFKVAFFFFVLPFTYFYSMQLFWKIPTSVEDFQVNWLVLFSVQFQRRSLKPNLSISRLSFSGENEDEKNLVSFAIFHLIPFLGLSVRKSFNFVRGMMWGFSALLVKIFKTRVTP